MPVLADDPLRKVTLNLYDSDVTYLQSNFGHGYSTLIRQIIHEYCQRIQEQSPTTIADLITEELTEDLEDE